MNASGPNETWTLDQLAQYVVTGLEQIYLAQLAACWL